MLQLSLTNFHVKSEEALVEVLLETLIITVTESCERTASYFVINWTRIWGDFSPFGRLQPFFNPQLLRKK